MSDSTVVGRCAAGLESSRIRERRVRIEGVSRAHPLCKKPRARNSCGLPRVFTKRVSLQKVIRKGKRRHRPPLPREGESETGDGALVRLDACASRAVPPEQEPGCEEQSPRERDESQVCPRERQRPHRPLSEQPLASPLRARDGRHALHTLGRRLRDRLLRGHRVRLAAGGDGRRLNRGDRLSRDGLSGRHRRHRRHWRSRRDRLAGRRQRSLLPCRNRPLRLRSGRPVPLQTRVAGHRGNRRDETCSHGRQESGYRSSPRQHVLRLGLRSIQAAVSTPTPRTIVAVPGLVKTPGDIGRDTRVLSHSGPRACHSG